MMKRVTIPALAVILLLSACTGSFTLTNKVSQFNKTFDNQWVEEVVFLAMVIVPVYELSLLADAVIFNSIEFWTGENPVAEEQLQIAIADDTNATMLSDGRIRLEVDGTVYLLERTEAGVVATDDDGDILYRAITGEDGKISVYDAAGKVVRKES
ncbi:DUF3332 family protein [Gemmatimonadota bacterium]